MPTPQSIESLKILMGGPRGRGQLPTEAYGFSSGVPTQGELESPFEVEQAARAARADAADRAATAKIQATNAAIQEHNRPDVTAIREEEEQDALKRLILPAQIKGQYDVAAAREHAAANAANTQALIGGREKVANINQGAATARTNANIKAQGLRQQYQGYASGKTHAPIGFLDSWIPGRQKAADQAAMEKLAADITAADAEEAAQPEEAAVAAPAGGDRAARLAALRAAMGR